MEITFLGTGTSQGIPVIGCDCKICESKNSKDKRLRSSIYIKYNNTNIIIDTGPDFRQQALKEKIKNLDFILYTHAHKDHTGGIDDIRSFNFFLKKKIPIYGNKKTMNQIINDYSYIFKKNNYTALPKLSINYINNDFKKKGILIKPIKVKHNKLDILGYRINNFTYITDANFISNNEKKKIVGSEVLVINCLQKDKHVSHFNLDEALSIIKELKVKKTYLTHISHNLGLHRETSKILPKGVKMAYDCLKISI
tara:strand:+ start:784 stop:1542 length:759 start_codon:yes stop_codon:yes gene_type:complete